MRGEHVSPARAISALRGSSPHARGAQDSRGFTASQSGIIPACAGSTAEGGRAQRHHEDHPRMRGEHLRSISSCRSRVGSSPHARGAQDSRGFTASQSGIIPACAGSTASAELQRAALEDHPRMRGEHCGLRFCISSTSGSSPHARGARFLWIFDADCHGIIPACAGSTPTAHPRPCDGRDHPRMRGEHATAVSRLPTTMGSSPHARGAPSHTGLRCCMRRIIPACAGSTFKVHPRPKPDEDHPRMRGEHAGTHRR